MFLKEPGLKHAENGFTVLVVQAAVGPVDGVTVKVPDEALKLKAGDILQFYYCYYYYHHHHQNPWKDIYLQSICLHDSHLTLVISDTLKSARGAFMACGPIDQHLWDREKKMLNDPFEF